VTKVLFLSAARTPDMSANFFWDGLQTALGEDNVADATGGPALRGKSDGCWGNDRPVRWRDGQHRVVQQGEDDFDILVATSTFLRDHDWAWLRGLAQRHLKKGGKIVWFDTLDGARDYIDPPIIVDAVFKREIDPAVQYPYRYKPLPLTCAIPERWFHCEFYGWTDQKPFDVFNVSNAVTTGHPTRWNSLSPTFGTRVRTNSLAGAGVLQPGWVYLHVARNFKIIIDAPGAEAASDGGRTWETIAMGGIPLFLEQSCRPRWPWFGGEHVFTCGSTHDLSLKIEECLAADIPAMRLRLREYALKWHTTEQRAKQFLEMVQADAWKGAPGPWRW
jgi:hypothetical protein